MSSTGARGGEEEDGGSCLNSSEILNPTTNQHGGWGGGGGPHPPPSFLGVGVFYGGGRGLLRLLGNWYEKAASSWMSPPARLSPSSVFNASTKVAVAG